MGRHRLLEDDRNPRIIMCAVWKAKSVCIGGWEISQGLLVSSCSDSNPAVDGYSTISHWQGLHLSDLCNIGVADETTNSHQPRQTIPRLNWRFAYCHAKSLAHFHMQNCIYFHSMRVELKGGRPTPSPAKDSASAK